MRTVQTQTPVARIIDHSTARIRILTNTHLMLLIKDDLTIHPIRGILFANRSGRTIGYLAENIYQTMSNNRYIGNLVFRNKQKYLPNYKKLADLVCDNVESDQFCYNFILIIMIAMYNSDITSFLQVFERITDLEPEFSNIELFNIQLTVLDNAERNRQ